MRWVTVSSQTRRLRQSGSRPSAKRSRARWRCWADSLMVSTVWNGEDQAEGGGGLAVGGGVAVPDEIGHGCAPRVVFGGRIVGAVPVGRSEQRSYGGMVRIAGHGNGWRGRLAIGRAAARGPSGGGPSLHYLCSRLLIWCSSSSRPPRPARSGPRWRPRPVPRPSAAPSRHAGASRAWRPRPAGAQWPQSRWGDGLETAEQVHAYQFPRSRLQAQPEPVVDTLGDGRLGRADREEEDIRVRIVLRGDPRSG